MLRFAFAGTEEPLEQTQHIPFSREKMIEQSPA